MAYHLVANPAAGRGRAKQLLDTVEQYLTENRLAFHSYLTERPGHASELVRHLPKDAVVLSLGGDGTLHEIAAACIGTARTVGILPAGSGDDFAFALGIERHHLHGALAIIRSGCVRQVDTAEVNGTPFINALGVGFDADVAHAVTRAPYPLRETSAYLYAVLSTLGKLRHIHVNVVVDGSTVHQGAALLVSTQNGPRTGGSFLFAPSARVDDGQLELVVAGQLGRLGAVNILPKVMRGKHLGHPKVKIFSGTHIQLSWAEARLAHMEGELLAATKQFDIRMRPASLRVFAPAQ